MATGCTADFSRPQCSIAEPFEACACSRCSLTRVTGLIARPLQSMWRGAHRCRAALNHRCKRIEQLVGGEHAELAAVETLDVVVALYGDIDARVESRDLVRR